MEPAPPTIANHKAALIRLNIAAIRAVTESSRRGARAGEGRIGRLCRIGERGEARLAAEPIPLAPPDQPARGAWGARSRATTRMRPAWPRRAASQETGESAAVVSG